MSSNLEMLRELYKMYKLTKEDVYKHKHYTIITKSGIDKIAAKENIEIRYEVVRCEKDFAAVKALASAGSLTIQTYGSATKGGGRWEKDPEKPNDKQKWVSEGNTDSWYVLEVAEKRAKSRAILMLAGLYELGVYGQDESDEFTKTGEFEESSPEDVNQERVTQNIINHISKSLSVKQLSQCFSSIDKDNDEVMNIYEEKRLELTFKEEKL